jgi:hypothetical protein
MAGLTDWTFEHLGDQSCDWRALASGQGHVGKEWVTFEGFHDRDHAIVATHPQVIALSDIVG